MGRRMTNGEFGAIAVLIVLALVVMLPIAGLIQLGNAFGWPVVIGTGIVVVIAVTAIRSARARASLRAVEEKLARRRVALLEVLRRKNITKAQ